MSIDRKDFRYSIQRQTAKFSQFRVRRIKTTVCNKKHLIRQRGRESNIYSPGKDLSKNFLSLNFV